MNLLPNGYSCTMYLVRSDGDGAVAAIVFHASNNFASIFAMRSKKADSDVLANGAYSMRFCSIRSSSDLMLYWMRVSVNDTAKLAVYAEIRRKLTQKY